MSRPLRVSAAALIVLLLLFMKAVIFHDMDVPPSPHPLISRWPPGLLSAPLWHLFLSLSSALTMLLLTIKGQSREREISRYFLIQRRSQRVKAWGRAKAEGWGCGRRKVLTLDHSDGHQGGEGTEEVTVQKPGLCPLPWQGSPVGDCPDLYAPPPCRLCTFIFARSSLGRHGRHLYLAAGRTFPSWDGTRSGWHPWGPGNEV